MDSHNSKDHSGKCEEVEIPSLPEGFHVSLERGDTLPSIGTNVVRVPFGIRQPTKKRPDRPQRWATLVLPFQPHDNPNPPPQAA